ncbi:MAG: TIGR02757 family protein [Cytophagaceae bacterium]|jgi:uncharacterized protein (TIGR02757 family)|nr:TIGR02757 family protein [Cytophagaceae bacterium]
MNRKERHKIFSLLEDKVRLYNRTEFIETDPICIPHRFRLKQDIEISGLFAALFAWGHRTIIINKATELLQRMDNAPYEFVLHHQEADLKNIIGFKHRTFNDTDILYFIERLRQHYTVAESLESAFVLKTSSNCINVEPYLNHFRSYIFETDYPLRTIKHIASPLQKSACKRLNMYLRWMVRKDAAGVDFGLWKHIQPAQLVCPMDVHVQRIASQLGLLPKIYKVDWSSAVALTNQLKIFHPDDPVRYDYALFGIGVVEKVLR